jgi:hypothetical protein
MMKNRMIWLGTVTAVAVVLLACATPQAPPPRLKIELGAGASFSPNTLGPAAILSPDGAVIVFVAQKAAE